MKSLRIAFFGSSLVSAYGNGAATYYRGILRALADRGHRITFYEPDAPDRQRQQDIPDPTSTWAEVVIYASDRQSAVEAALASAQGSDLVVKASGVGVYDEWLERNVLGLQSATCRVAFWDADAPATLERMRKDPSDPFRPLISGYDIILTYGGGPPVITAYRDLGARQVVPIFNAFDPDTHHPDSPDPRFVGDLGLLANRLPDREARVDEFFFSVAAAMPASTFVLGGSGWEDKVMPRNVRYVGHVYTREHNAFNSSTRAVLTVHRESTARIGYSPAPRVFEAAGARACIITDRFLGVERFLQPRVEVLVADGRADVVKLLSSLTPREARAIGAQAMRRVLGHHTYDHRAEMLVQALAFFWPRNLYPTGPTAASLWS